MNKVVYIDIVSHSLWVLQVILQWIMQMHFGEVIGYSYVVWTYENDP